MQTAAVAEIDDLRDGQVVLARSERPEGLLPHVRELGVRIGARGSTSTLFDRHVALDDVGERRALKGEGDDVMLGQRGGRCLALLRARGPCCDEHERQHEETPSDGRFSR